jgi:hypothetical protein
MGYMERLAPTGRIAPPARSCPAISKNPDFSTISPPWPPVPSQAVKLCRAPDHVVAPLKLDKLVRQIAPEKRGNLPSNIATSLVISI